MSEPRMPSRVRLHRPDLWRDEVTGRLPAAARDLYLGLGTVTDDDGYALWRPASLAAVLYPFLGAAARERALERHARILEAAGLLERMDCGCAFLPRFARDQKQQGGDPTRAVLAFHVEHYVGLRSATSSDSVSVSVSDSVSGPGANGSEEPSTKRPDDRPRPGETLAQYVARTGGPAA